MTVEPDSGKAARGSVSPHSPALPAGPAPRRALLRFAVFVVVVLGGLVALKLTPLGRHLDLSAIDHETVLALVADLRSRWWTPLALLGGYVVACVFALPVTPFLFAGGAIFGAVTGTAYNLVGSILGAAAGHFFATHFGRHFVQHLLGERLVRVEQALEKSSFWALVRARWLPLPFPLVNFAAALIGVRFVPYITSTALGLVPPVILFTTLYAGLLEASGARRAGEVAGLILILFALFLVSLLPSWLSRRRARRADAGLPPSPPEAE